jgi:hypothetical protein
MEGISKALLGILFVSGFLVSTTCFYISFFNDVFFGTAIVVLTIVIITVFVIVVYNIYDNYLEK